MSADTPAGMVADYADSSGRYRIYVWGSLMLTDFDGEAWTATLTRAPEWDLSPVWEEEELLLDDATGYASGEIAPDVWGVRIGGKAYLADFRGGMAADRAREILSALGYGDDDTDPLAHAGNVVTLPGDPAVIGATELEPDGSEEFAALAVAVCYVRGGWDRA